jgi:hypothetical protein
MRSSVIIAALAASFASAEPEARAEPEPLPAPQRQIGAILGILGIASAMQGGKSKGTAAKGGGQCSCSTPRTTDAYCRNNNEVGPSDPQRRDV